MTKDYTTAEILTLLGIPPEDKRARRNMQSRLHQLRRGQLVKSKRVKLDGTVSTWDNDISPLLIEGKDWVDRGGGVILYTAGGVRKILDYYSEI